MVRLFVGVAFGVLLMGTQCKPRADASLWEGRGKVFVWGDTAPPSAQGTRWVMALEAPAIAQALGGTDAAALHAKALSAGFEGLWFTPALGAPVGPDAALHRRFSGARYVPGFAGELLSSRGLLFVPTTPHVPRTLSATVLAKAARTLLEGAEPPATTSFPIELRDVQNVEVLVLLRERPGGQVRLWRSSRASSLIDGVVRASVAARERWSQREAAMGGPLAQKLAELDVEVALLLRDGTFADRALAFLDRAISPIHGVAYEEPGRWRYLLPQATQRAGSPTDAFGSLFVENGLPPDSFDRPELTLYRFVMQTISVDQGRPQGQAARGATP